ncbi:hypothetical protein GQ44DRAFT_796697 [Phaeosphaeriaceae sp. PMI808]|nr:hypothetical protein GQ44DRAFT_796697 [Phaeosphaeriaceae sp. PMI808]
MNQPITDVVSAFRMPTELSSLGRNIREREPDSRTANYDAAIDIKGAESLVSFCLQQAATSVNDTEEDLEDVHAPKTGSRGKKRKRHDSHVSEAGHSMSKLEREGKYVEKVIRQSIRKTSLVLREDIPGLALADINIYMETLSTFVRALEALQNTE